MLVLLLLLSNQCSFFKKLLIKETLWDLIKR